MAVKHTNTQTDALLELNGFELLGRHILRAGDVIKVGDVLGGRQFRIVRSVKTPRTNSSGRRSSGVGESTREFELLETEISAMEKNQIVRSAKTPRMNSSGRRSSGVGESTREFELLETEIFAMEKNRRKSKKFRRRVSKNWAVLGTDSGSESASGPDSALKSKTSTPVVIAKKVSTKMRTPKSALKKRRRLEKNKAATAAEKGRVVTTMKNKGPGTKRILNFSPSIFVAPKRSSGKTPDVDLRGQKDMVKTPQKTPSLMGVRNLMKSPRSQPPTPLEGLKKMMVSPKVRSDSPSLSGVKKLLNPPKEQKTPSLKGLRDLLKSPRSQPPTPLEGLKRMVVSPRVRNDTPLSGVRKLLKSPNETKTKSPRLSGVADLMKSVEKPTSLQSTQDMYPETSEDDVEESPASTQRKQQSGRNERRSPSENFRRIKDRLKSPKELQTPNYVGVKELMKSPKTRKSASLGGVKQMMTEEGETSRLSAYGGQFRYIPPRHSQLIERG